MIINVLCTVLKGDTKNDLLLFTLAALLSSTLVYNSRGTIDQQAIDRLRSVSTTFILYVNSETRLLKWALMWSTNYIIQYMFSIQCCIVVQRIICSTDILSFSYVILLYGQ